MKPSTGWIEAPGFVLLLAGWLALVLPFVLPAPESYLPLPMWYLFVLAAWTGGLVAGLHGRRTLYGKIAILLNVLSIVFFGWCFVLLILNGAG